MGYIFFNKTKFYSHPIYDSYYASKKGEIYSSKSNKILKLGTHTNGYLFFIIFNKTKIQINCGGKREEIYKLNKKIIIINDLHKRRNRKIFRNIKKLQ